MLMFTGLAAGAVVLKDAGSTTSTTQVGTTDTTATFEDTNGNGIDDDCEATVNVDPAAEAAAALAVDENGDGVVSVSEAAHSDRVGGTNCNHGGYVSGVSQGEESTAAAPRRWSSVH